MIELHRLWNHFGGPFGAWPFFLLLIFWLFLLPMIRRAGAFREGGYLSPALWGSVLLLVLHLALRTLFSQNQPEQGIAIWEIENLPDGLATALRAECEHQLRLDPELPWPLRIMHPYAENAQFPTDEASRLRIMQGLDLRFLYWASIQSGIERPALFQWRIYEQRENLLSIYAQGTRPFTDLDEVPEILSTTLESELGLSVNPQFAQPWAPFAKVSTLLFSQVADSARRAMAWSSLSSSGMTTCQKHRLASLLLSACLEPSRTQALINQALTEGDAEDPRPFVLAAKWFMQQAEWDKVRQALANGLALAPKNPELLALLLQLNASGQRDFGFASPLALHERIVDLHGLWVTQTLALADLQMQGRRGLEAIEGLDFVRCAYPMHPELRLLRANIAYELMDFYLADTLYQGLMDEFPTNALYWRNMGQLNFMVADYEGALIHLSRAIELGSSPSLLHWIGLSYLALGDTTSAIQAFRRRMRHPGERQELQRSARQLRLIFPDGPPSDRSQSASP
jgi:tetratricopeptide (TPR) repeat protein